MHREWSEGVGDKDEGMGRWVLTLWHSQSVISVILIRSLVVIVRSCVIVEVFLQESSNVYANLLLL
jgi:hypothetical protein